AKLNSRLSFHKNENISLESNEILKPDLLFYSMETEGVVIVELKNSANATRQLGTEIYAYSGEVKSYVPFLSYGDIFYVIISSDWPTLLRHFIFHEIYWEEKNILCLEPIENNSKRALKIKNIPELLEDVSSLKIPQESVTGYQICLYDHGLYKSEHDRTRLDGHLNQMKASLHVMATEGNKQNAHGFAFLWKDNREFSLAPYSITVLNLSPFSSIERFLHAIDDLSDLTEMQERLFGIVQSYDPSGHGRSLSRIRETAENFLKHFCNPISEAYTSWVPLKDFMLENSELIAFQGWGLFEYKFSEELVNEFSKGNIQISHLSPELGLKVVESLIDMDYCFYDIHLFNLKVTTTMKSMINF
ncbi:hypothetical protein, partial [Leptospira kmetyi]|uniref:hypothetical protein n=1 Tax=Leptospira kmetyi TaxID=408139 RepID=UPI0014383120